MTHPKNKTKKICKIYKCYLLYALLYGIGCISLNLRPAITSATRCDDLRFIFARGSGEELDGPSYTAWKTEIDNDFQGKGLKYGFYELGSSEQNGFQYPAVEVAGNLKGYLNLAGAAISGGKMYGFGISVNRGMGELISYLNQESLTCPGMRYVLGGYSQGAMVMSQSLPYLDASKIVYVATFGDPKIYLPEGKKKLLDQPDACKGKNLSDYRVYVPDCYTYEGILGGIKDYEPDNLRGKVGVWCNTEDIMCSSHMSVDSHTSYVSDNLYAGASDEIYEVTRKTFPKLSKNHSRPLHEVVFVMDSSESMGFGMKRYKDQIRYLASEIIRTGGRVALVEYRDLWDSSGPYVRIDFTNDQEAFEQVLDNITAYGGTKPVESALAALKKALNSLSWTNGATKSAFVITDEGYRNPDIGGTTIEEIVQRSLEIDPVNIYVAVGEELAKSYSKITEPTGGLVFPSLARIGDEEFSKIVDRPVAALNHPSYSGKVGDTLYFDASSSYALDSGTLQYDWDLDGDGIFELLGVSAKVSKEYPIETSHYIQLRTIDQSGKSSTMSALVEISSQISEATPTTITNLSQTWLPDEILQVEFTTDAENILLSSEDGALGFLEVDNKNVKFQIKDVETPTSLLLIPYSKEEIRGTTYSFTTLESPSSDKNNMDEDDKQEASDSSLAPSQPDHSTHPSIPEQIPEHYVGLVDPRKIALPKAPKSGAVSAKK